MSSLRLSFLSRLAEGGRPIQQVIRGEEGEQNITIFYASAWNTIPVAAMRFFLIAGYRCALAGPFTEEDGVEIAAMFSGVVVFSLGAICRQTDTGPRRDRYWIEASLIGLRGTETDVIDDPSLSSVLWEMLTICRPVDLEGLRGGQIEHYCDLLESIKAEALPSVFSCDSAVPPAGTITRVGDRFCARSPSCPCFDEDETQPPCCVWLLPLPCNVNLKADYIRVEKEYNDNWDGITTRPSTAGTRRTTIETSGGEEDSGFTLTTAVPGGDDEPPPYSRHDTEENPNVRVGIW